MLFFGNNPIYICQSDPRVEQYPFLGSPFPIALLVVGYVYFVLRLGPRLMRDRKPFDLTTLVNAYNFLQICANLYLGVWVRITIKYFAKSFHYNRLCVQGTWNSYVIGQMEVSCTPINYLTTPEMTEVVMVTYLYYMLKVSDLFDTVKVS